MLNTEAIVSASTGFIKNTDHEIRISCLPTKLYPLSHFYPIIQTSPLPPQPN